MIFQRKEVSAVECVPLHDSRPEKKEEEKKESEQDEQ